MKNIEIQRDGKTYCFNFEEAIKQGLLKELRTFNVTITEDQVAALLVIGGRIGGPPGGARGEVSKFLTKLIDLGEMNTDLDLTICYTHQQPAAIYFKN